MAPLALFCARFVTPSCGRALETGLTPRGPSANAAIEGCAEFPMEAPLWKLSDVLLLSFCSLAMPAGALDGRLLTFRCKRREDVEDAKEAVPETKEAAFA